MVDSIKRLIRDIPDFPKPGIVFKDITPLLAHPAEFAHTIQLMAEGFRDQKIDRVVGIESRGFIFGAALAMEIGAGFIPIRKPGKLPYDTISEQYELEYGNDRVEMHVDAVREGQRILMVDDLLATGGTMGACCKLIRSLGAEIVSAVFLIELSFLEGRKRLMGIPVRSLIEY